MVNKFMHGSSILLGDNTIPGVQLPRDLKEYVPIILQACREWGLDFYPTVVQLLTYDEISEVAAYGGFPVRYPHWSFGMEFEELQRGYEYGMHRIYEMVINCLHPDMLVLTKRGTIKAINIQSGDEVVLGNESRKVVAKKVQSLSKTKQIKLHGVGRPLICTENHKWKVIAENGLVWKKTSDLVSGDLLIGADAFNYHRNVSPSISNPEELLSDLSVRSKSQLKEITVPKTLTLELAELLGILTGDGSIGVKGNANDLYVTVGKEFLSYARYVADLFEKSFGAVASIQEKPSAFVVTLQSLHAVKIVDKLGLPAGCTYVNKRIPKIIWEASQEFRAAYLRGLFDTDGYASNGLGMSGYNAELVYDVQHMLLEMGISSIVDIVPNGHNQITVLNVRGRPSLEKYLVRIGFVLEHKKDGLKSLINTRSCRGGGVHVPYIQKKLVEWTNSQNINTYNNPSLGRSANAMSYEKFGINALNSFIERVIANSAYECLDDELVKLARLPIYSVCEISDGPETKTVDIALDDEAHDFLAGGFITHNTNPCYIHCLNSNSLLDHLTVVAHATGHNDFFKNNIHFEVTDTTMLNKMANHGTRIRRYMSRWGKERVIEFIDHVLRIDTLVDGAKAWTQKVVRDRNIVDKRKFRQPRRLKVEKQRLYMEPYINTKEFRQEENRRIAEKDIADEIGLFTEPTKDILGFLRDNAPLKPWQQDIVAMLYEESLYFYPQRQTKVMNEGWASFTDHVIMARQGYVSLGQEAHDCGIIDYADHKMGVLGGKYSMNPYKLGFYMFLDIEERWDKGQFGTEWEECTDIREKEKWDTEVKLGKEKVFEVRKYYDDLTFLNEFFTEDFCRKQEYFYWKHYPNGEFHLEHRKFKDIKHGLMRRHLNGGLPDIRLTEPNYRGKGGFMLQHEYDGRSIYDPYVKDVLTSLRFIWNNDIYLATQNKDGNEKVYCCYGTNAEEDVEVVSRKEHTKNWN